MGFRGRKMPEYRMPWPMVLYLVMVVIYAIYGVLMSEGYWDYKLLVSNFLAFFLGVGYFYFAQPSKVAVTFKVWMFFSGLFFLLFSPFIFSAGAMYLLPFSFLLLFLPLFDNKGRVFVLCFAFLAVVSGTIGARSSIVRFVACSLFSVCIGMRRYFSKSLIKSLVFVEFLLPVVLAILGFSGVFNVFQIGDSVGASSVEIEDSADGVGNLGADTRSFIYLEEVASSIKNSYYIQGRSLSRGYDSDFFMMSDDEMMGRGERGSSEVSLLNTFNYFGLIGVVITFILYFTACLNAFRRGKSKMIFFIALYLGFRWMWSFVEDQISFNMNTICLWVALSMCFSPFFCGMSDSQFCDWARSFFRISPVKSLLESSGKQS